MDIRIRFVPPELPHQIADFIQSIEDDEVEEELLRPLDDATLKYYDAVLDNYDGYLYQIDGWGWEDKYYELVLTTDDDGQQFAADMIGLLSGLGASDVHAWDESLESDAKDILEIRLEGDRVVKKLVPREEGA